MTEVKPTSVRKRRTEPTSAVEALIHDRRRQPRGLTWKVAPGVPTVSAPTTR